MSHLHHRVREITNHYGELESLFGQQHHGLHLVTGCTLVHEIGQSCIRRSPNRLSIPNDGAHKP
jgi:hypothetical protein